MKVNWLVRFKNKNFWISFIPALLVLVQVGLAIFDVQLNLGDLQAKILTFVNAAFSVLIIMGVINDPTTNGLGDTEQAMEYKTPRKEIEDV